MLRVSGLPATDLTARAIPKELIAIAGPAEGETKKSWSDEPVVPADELCRDYFRLFDGVREAARAARAEASCFGIMGSSIAAAWLAGELGEIAFFADEDESRRGNTLMGRPIVGLAEVPAGATVFIPMSRNVAERIIARAGRLPIEFRYLDWNRLDPLSGVVRPPKETREARRRA